MSATFYKTTDGTALAAWLNYEVEAAKVAAAGKAFAEHFGGKLLTRSDSHGRSVAGLRFSPAKDDLLWTKPDQQASGMQHPRCSLRKGTKEQRQALAALLTDWAAHFPKEKADLAPVLSAMGTDWGALFFCDIDFFVHDNAIYVNTSATLAPCMVEILGSEYSAAKAAHESIKGGGNVSVNFNLGARSYLQRSCHVVRLCLQGRSKFGNIRKQLIQLLLNNRIQPAQLLSYLPAHNLVFTNAFSNGAVSIKKCEKQVHFGIDTNHEFPDSIIRDRPHLLCVRPVHRETEARTWEDHLQRAAKQNPKIGRNLPGNIIESRGIHLQLREQADYHLPLRFDFVAGGLFFQVAQLPVNTKPSCKDRTNGAPCLNPGRQTGVLVRPVRIASQAHRYNTSDTGSDCQRKKSFLKHIPPYSGAILA